MPAVERKPRREYIEVSAADYETIRAELDKARGYPQTVNGVTTATTLPPAEEMPVNEDGSLSVCVEREYMDIVEKAAALETVRTSRMAKLDEATFRQKVEAAHERAERERETKPPSGEEDPKLPVNPSTRP